MDSYFERLEASAKAMAEGLADPERASAIAKGSMEAHATMTLTLAVQTSALAICEALGGVDNSLAALTDIDGQLNTLGGEVHEQMRTTNRLLEEIDRALRG